jgi:hypothetical protein
MYRGEMCIQGFGEETWWKQPLVRPRLRWKDNIKTGLQEVGWGLDWIDLAQDKDRRRALVNTVMNLGVL